MKCVISIPPFWTRKERDEFADWWHNALMCSGSVETKAANRNPEYTGDKPAPKPGVERVHEWGHAPTDEYCYRKEKLIHTPVQKAPHVCKGCTNEKWDSKGIVHRLKDATKQIIYREKV